MGDGRFPPTWLDVARALLPTCLLVVGLVLLAVAALAGVVIGLRALRAAAARRARVRNVQLVHYALDGADLVLDFLTPPSRRRHPFGSPVFAVRTPVGTWVDLDLFVRLDYWVRHAPPLALRLRRPGRRPVQRLLLSDGIEEVRITARWSATPDRAVVPA